MTSNPKFIISYEDLGDGEFLTTLTIRAPSQFHSGKARLEQARRAWNAVVREYGVKSDADALEFAPPAAVRH